MYANIFSGESRARPLCDKFPASGTRAPLPSPERITTYRSLETTHVRHCMSYNGKCCRVKCVEVKKALLFHSWLSTYQLWKRPCVKVFAWTNYTLNLKKHGLVNSHAHCGPDKYRLTRKKKSAKAACWLDWATTRVYDSVWQIMWA